MVAKVYETRHGPMMVDDNDRYLGRALRELGEFGEPQLEAFRRVVTKNSIVCDVGANVGAFTVPLARLAKHVHAFEPQRYVYHMLCGNVALAHVNNVSCHHVAVGERDEMVDIAVLDVDKPGNNFGAFSLDMPGQKLDRVRVVPLTIPCDFLKIDVEGHEAAVLRGARMMIATCKPVIYMENDRHDKADALIAAVRALGYTPYWHVTPLFRLANFRGEKSDIFGGVHSFDMLCTPGPVDTDLPEAFPGDFANVKMQEVSDVAA